MNSGISGGNSSYKRRVFSDWTDYPLKMQVAVTVVVFNSSMNSGIGGNFIIPLCFQLGRTIPLNMQLFFVLHVVVVAAVFVFNSSMNSGIGGYFIIHSCFQPGRTSLFFFFTYTIRDL